MNTATMATGKQRSSFPVAFFKGLLCTLLIGGASVIAAAFLALCFPDPASAVRPIAYCVLALCAFWGGGITAKFTRGAFLSGILMGAVLSILLFILSLIFQVESAIPFPFPLFFYAAVVLLAGLGGLVGKPRRPKRRRLR